MKQIEDTVSVASVQPTVSTALLVEVVAPAALSALGSGGLAILFFAQLPRLGASPVGPALFVASLVLGIVLVWAAGEACRPVVRAAVR